MMNMTGKLPIARLAYAARASCCALLLVAGMSAAPQAAAQINPDMKVEVAPAVAGPGVARKITISLVTGCLPQATVVGAEIGRKRTLSIRLDQPTPFFCDAFSRYTVAVTYTPQAEGDVKLLVVTNLGAYVGETTIHTRAANSDRSQFDLTGMWYDPATYGSGLTFIHGFTRDDVLFGTWYVYDAAGAPRWYTIQSVVWKARGQEAEGLIYETTGNSVNCLPPLSACPVTYATVAPRARARIVMQGPNSALIQALTSGDAVLFTSNIIRSIF